MTDAFQNLHKSKAEITEEIHSIASYLPGMIRVFVPSSAINKVPEGWELWQTQKTNTSKSDDESNLERSVRRSKRTVFDLVLCNSFELFATFTMARDRYDEKRSKEKIFNWLHNQRARNGKFKYLIVPEHHKDGALHFHAVIGGYQGKLKQSFGPREKPIIKYEKPVFEFPEYKSGYTSVQEIGNEKTDRSMVAMYLTKYITKDMDTVTHQRRFWASTGLNRPITEDNPTWWEKVVPDIVYENEFGKQLIYSDLTNKQLPAYVNLFTDNGHL
jgi:hypothetical protein